MNPMLVTICNDKWMCSHLRRWYRYAKRYSGCRLGLIAITDDKKMLGELKQAFDALVVCSPENDKRGFYNEVRMMIPDMFGNAMYCDCDADVWEDLTGLMDGDFEIGAVKSPSEHGDWTRIGEGKQEVNNGFLVLKYKGKTNQVVEAYKTCHDSALKMKCNPRTSGTMAFNMMFHSAMFKVQELPYKTSVIWWDSANLPDAKIVQWCNDQGQAKRLSLQAEWIKGKDLLKELE